MSVDEILFSPFVTREPWRALVDSIDAYYRALPPSFLRMPKRYPIDRPRPKGSLLLMGLMERYHRDGQTFFYHVSSRFEHRLDLPFDGGLYFGKYEDKEYPRLFGRASWSIRDLNLYPNTYNLNYVFHDLSDAYEYQQTLPGGHP